MNREVARDDVPNDEEALDDWGHKGADFYIYTFLIRATQIANKSTYNNLLRSYIN